MIVVVLVRGIDVLLVAVVADVVIAVLLREAERVERAQEQGRDEAEQQREGACSSTVGGAPGVVHDP